MEELEKILVDFKDIPDSDIFIQSLYEYYRANNFSGGCLNRIQYLTYIDVKTLETYIYDYVKNTLRMTKKEFDAFKTEEREKIKSIYTGKENIILIEMGVSTNYLWTNPIEKEFFLKTIYEYSKSNNFSEESINKLSKKLNIKPDLFLELIKEYMKDYLKADKGDQARMDNTKLRECYQKLMNASTGEEFEKIAKEFGFAVSYITINFNLFKKFYSKRDVDNFYKSYALYRQYMSDKKKERLQEASQRRREYNLKKQEETAKSVVRAYVNRKEGDLAEFLYVNKLTSYYFFKYVDIVQDCDKELYEEYKNSKYLKKMDKKEEIAVQLKKIVDGIKNGYEENGRHRNFDVLDYLFITKTPINNVLIMSQGILSANEQLVLKKFKKSYEGCEKYKSADEKAILEEKRIINLQYDAKGRLIENSGRLITDEEKEALLYYLSIKAINVNRMTYSAALKRYINDFIDIEKYKGKSLTLEKK